MPGKVNPVLCEAVLQVVAQVIGCDATVAFAGSQGNFELNTFMPVMARNVLEPIRLLAASMTVFTERCVQGLTADVETCLHHASTSPALATALTTLVGYDRATEIVHQAVHERSSIRDVAVATGVLDAAAADVLLDPLRLATS
jgi:fumarate hydratase class II